MKKRITGMVCILIVLAASMVWANGSAETAEGNAVPFPQGDTLTFVCPVSAGGQMDLQSRIVAKYLSEEIGKNVIIDNIPGGGTVIGTKTYLADSKDSDSIVNLSADHMVFSPIVQKADYSYESFVPLVALSNTEPYFWVNSDSEYKTWEDVMAKGKTEKIIFGTGAPGSAGFLATKLATMASGIKMDYVVGNSIPESLANMMGGHVEMVLADYPTGKEYYKAGKIRPIIGVGVNEYLGDDKTIAVPTMKSMGIDFSYASCNMLAIRSDADPEAISFMREALATVYANPDFQADWAKAGQPLLEDSSYSFGENILKEKVKSISQVNAILAGN